MHAHFVDRLYFAWPLSALLLAALAGCSSTEILNSAGPCVQGQSELCSCSSGAVGFRTCSPDSEYGQCRCDALSTGGTAGAIAGAAGSAGFPIGGSSGIGGEAAVGGINTMAGVGGAGVTGGAGAGGVSGMSAGMTGGSAGAGGMSSGGTAGASGIDGNGGMAGDGSGGNSGPGRDPKPGELYGDCRPGGECDDGLLCVNDGSSGFPEAYCSTTCDAFNPMCPRSRGGGMVVCLFGICLR